MSIRHSGGGAETAAAQVAVNHLGPHLVGDIGSQDLVVGGGDDLTRNMLIDFGAREGTTWEIARWPTKIVLAFTWWKTGS